MTAEELAQFFHETYERLAPAFGYETRPETAVPWQEIPADNRNKRLMIAVAEEVLKAKSEQHEYVDATTGIRLVVEPELLDPDRISMYAPDGAARLTSEQCQHAMSRLVYLLREIKKS